MIEKFAGSSVVPTLRYRDLDRAVAWLTGAFGFSLHRSVQDAEGRIVSAQLVLGNGMVMLAPVGLSGFDELMKQPDEIDGAETQSCYFVVTDAEAHYANAKANGADILLDLQNFEHGGCGYLCRDVEGHLWSFGTFNPWRAPRAPATGRFAQLLELTDHPQRQLTLAGLTAAGLFAAGALLVMSWQVGDVSPSAVAGSDPAHHLLVATEREARLAAESELAKLRSEKDSSDTDGDKLQEQLEHLTIAREAAERSARRLVARAVSERQHVQTAKRRADELGKGLDTERQARQKSERAFLILKGQLEKELLAKDNLERARAEAEASLSKEREAKKQAVEQLKKEQDARKAAEIVAQQMPAVARTNKLSPPKPAVRPEPKASPQQGGANSGGEPMPAFQP